MSANVYDVGDLVRISAVFKNSAGTATDPTAVSCKIRKSDGTVTTLVYGTDVALVRDSEGNYHTDISITLKGLWMHKFIGTGAVQATEVGALLGKSSLIE
jgi:hypothetical protein